MIKRFFFSVLLCTVCVFAMAQSQTVTHVVQRGETIESIAEYYKVSVEDINKANPNAGGMFYVGMKLNIPASVTPQKETKISETPKNSSPTVKNSNPAVKNSALASPDTYTPESKAGRDDKETTLGFQMARVKGSYIFPTKLEKSSRGHYKSSYALYFDIEGEYVFNPNLFAGFGLGYMAQGSCNSDRQTGDGIRYSQYKSQYHYVMLPLSIGYRMPVTKSVNFDVYTGPVFTCVVAGDLQNRASTSEEWNKTKLKDMDDPKRFTPFWNVGARVNLWGIELGAEYWYLLTKTNEGGSKSAIAAYFSLHI